ncbi:hypothetical protein LTR09_000324 [Extremus antarcticus]|uniref:TLC domain-containing protein n=1 Tax=Extremus antarcticus TaxID=702011 RepID=A0AAJ0GJF7_9PEZI|nr:hypothetical protein LTR09_000324 [Extremus antarcticus]
MDSRPLRIVSATAIAYIAAFIGFRHSHILYDRTAALKAISSFHSTLTAIFGIIALSQPWPIRMRDVKQHVKPGQLNDSRNPIIFGQSAFGNAVTAIETGFLLYDTIATLIIHYEEYCTKKQLSWIDATKLLFRKEPVTLWHHLSILTALGYFQIYCLKGQERGVWIIVAFILMNASTPIMQLRWWRRKSTGQSSLTLDILFCIVFGICRLGTVFYVFRVYGQYHGIGTLQAFTRQKWICQVSTGALFALNAVWWATLARNTGRKIAKACS